MGRGGTVAAGELLVDERRMKEVLAHAHRTDRTQNIEVALETQAMQGRTDEPLLRANYCLADEASEPPPRPVRDPQ